MELRNARLCLDCEEVHGEQQCPVCGSETFTFMTRWVPAATAGRRARQTTSQEADVYRRLISGDAAPSKTRQILKRGVVGLTALGLVGLFFGGREARKADRTSASAGNAND